MKEILLTGLAGLAAIVLALGAVFGIAYAANTLKIPTETANTYVYYNFFTATTTSATSTNLTGGGGYMAIKGAKKVTMYFSRGGATSPNTGSSRFRTQVTPDGSTWYDYDQLHQIDDVYSSASYDTRVGTSTIAAATSTNIFAVDKGNFLGIRCIVVEVTDGEHTCNGSAEF